MQTPPNRIAAKKQAGEERVRPSPPDRIAARVHFYFQKTTKGAQEKINSWLEHMPSEGPASETSVFNNDPSAGSPTETLLRLLLPLNDQV